MFRKPLCALCLLTGFLLFSAACSKSITNAGKGFFWKAEKDGKVIYLLGSVHALPLPIKSFSPEIEAALTNVDIVASEMDYRDTNTWESYNRMLIWKNYYPVGSSLNDYFTHDEIIRISNLIPSKGMQKYIISNRLWAINGVLSWQSLDKYSKIEYGVENTIYRILEKYPLIKTGSLNNPLEMLNATVSIPESYYITNIMKSVIYLEFCKTNQNKTLPDLMTSWIQGCWTNFEKLDIQNFIRQDQEYNEMMIFSRNDKMISRIIELNITFPRVMAVAGVSHMVGPRGLPEQLRKLGYTLTHY